MIMIVPILCGIGIKIGLGAIPGVLAKRKHRSRALWWVAGTFGFLIALVSILRFRDLEEIPDGQKAASKLKEKIVLVVIVVLWAAMFVATGLPSLSSDGLRGVKMIVYILFYIGTAIAIGYVAQVYKEKTGVLWFFLTLICSAGLNFVFTNVVASDPKLSASPTKEFSINIAALLLTAIVMGLIVATLPKRKINRD